MALTPVHIQATGRQLMSRNLQRNKVGSCPNTFVHALSVTTNHVGLLIWLIRTNFSSSFCSERSAASLLLLPFLLLWLFQSPKEADIVVAYESGRGGVGFGPPGRSLVFHRVLSSLCRPTIARQRKRLGVFRRCQDALWRPSNTAKVPRGLGSSMVSARCDPNLQPRRRSTCLKNLTAEQPHKNYENKCKFFW